MHQSIKAFSVVIALTIGLLGVSAAARADDIQSGDGQYQFTINDSNFNFQASGVFDLNGAVASNFIGYSSYGDGINGISYSNGNLGNNGNGSYFVIASGYNIGGTPNYYFKEDLSHFENTYQENSGGVYFSAFFVSPSGGNSSSASGGAPSPEVNALLGFLVVAGTVALVKRRVGDKAEAVDAVA